MDVGLSGGRERLHGRGLPPRLQPLVTRPEREHRPHDDSRRGREHVERDQLYSARNKDGNVDRLTALSSASSVSGDEQPQPKDKQSAPRPSQDEEDLEQT